MNILLYISVLLVNGLFMMLTTLLPILIFNLTGSSLYVGQVLSTFMVSLMMVRIFCIRYETKTSNLLLYGSVAFLVGFILIFICNTILWIYYVGAIFFGGAIAILSPVLLTILTTHSKHKTKSIRMYNSLVAVSSAISPGIAEALRSKGLVLLTAVWVMGALILVFIASYVFKAMKNMQSNRIKRGSKENVKASGISVLKAYKKVFLVLFFASISYGAIISYLPVYYETIHSSIGLFYLLFWSLYVLAQAVGEKIVQQRGKSKIIMLCLFALFVAQIVINVQHSIYCEVFSASLYGFSYGLMYYVFYQQIASYKDEHIRSNGFALVGLMSYIGVGVAPIFLYPFLGDINTLFTYSSIYIGVAIICLYMCSRKCRDVL